MKRKTDAEVEAERQELLGEIRSLKRALISEQRIVKEKEDQLRLVDEVRSLKEQITDLEIKKAKLVEDQERRLREVEHKVGLERTRQAQELELARREVKVTVQEENLAADKARFDEQIKFTTDRFTKETDYLRDIMGQIMERLPTVTIDRSIDSPPKKEDK